ncbi:18661_t:CDS:2, partial [Gigaspora margarita]
GKWQYRKPTMEVHLALHCKGLVLDDIRRRWLIEVAKRALDGWTLLRGDSLYAFIITTPNRHEYLYTLADYSEEHQTENFIANKISDIIENIAGDLVKAISIKKTLKQANILIAFFQKLHLASKLLRDTISSMNIKGGSLETYSETYWILEEKPNIFTNQEVFQIVCDEDDTFYISCKRISLIFKPIKRVITLLESRTANLADCFIGIVQIAVALKRIPTSNNFYTLAIAAFNFHYQQFDISSYLLTYYFHPNYQNKGLKNRKFLDISEIAINYYKEVHHNDKEYPIEDENSDLQELAKTMFAIVPLQANCDMAQLHSFYILNVEKELKLHDFTENNQMEPILTEEETEETSMEFE